MTCNGISTKGTTPNGMAYIHNKTLSHLFGGPPITHALVARLFHNFSSPFARISATVSSQYTFGARMSLSTLWYGW